MIFGLILSYDTPCSPTYNLTLNGRNLKPPVFIATIKPASYLGGLSVPTMHRLISRGLLKPNHALRHLFRTSPVWRQAAPEKTRRGRLPVGAAEAGRF
jgi:hypothetical protein